MLWYQLAILGFLSKEGIYVPLDPDIYAEVVLKVEYE